MAWDTVTFSTTAGGSSFTVNRPAWGYEVEIHMPITVSKAADGTYGFFDPVDEDGYAGTYDYRVLSSALWRMTAAQKTNLNAFMRDPALGRAVDFNIDLGETASGFFPGGPDLYDNGTFRVREVSREQSGRQVRPWRWFEDDGALVIVTPEDDPRDYYTAWSQGKLFIGDIATGFMYPQDGFKPSAQYSLQTQLLITGVPSSINGPVAGDSWETSFELLCNTKNAAALISYLTTHRTNDMTLQVPAYHDPFGIDQIAFYGTYTAKFLGSERTDREMILRVKHIGHEQFLIPLSFWMKGKL
jgi:hypothetical protein